MHRLQPPAAILLFHDWAMHCEGSDAPAFLPLRCIHIICLTFPYHHPVATEFGLNHFAFRQLALPYSGEPTQCSSGLRDFRNNNNCFELGKPID
jgi:hypothetical protein